MNLYGKRSAPHTKTRKCSPTRDTKKAFPIARNAVEIFRSQKNAILLNALLAELSAASCALTCFELRVGLADHVKCAVTLHHLAIFVAALH